MFTVHNSQHQEPDTVINFRLGGIVEETAKSDNVMFLPAGAICAMQDSSINIAGNSFFVNNAATEDGGDNGSGKQCSNYGGVGLLSELETVKRMPKTFVIAVLSHAWKSFDKQTPAIPTAVKRSSCP